MLIILLLFSVIFLDFSEGSSGPNVIIIGAGASGIAAASKLLENDIENITILEAEDRIGGRIHSVKFGDEIVDLGAEWCHGEKNNIVYELVKDLNLLQRSNITSNVRCTPLQNFDEDFKRELEELVLYIYKEEKEEGISVGEFFIKRYNSSITERYGDDSKKMKYALDFLKLAEELYLSVDGSFTWFEESAKSNFESCEGDQALNWKGRGYKTILDFLLKKYPDTNQAVQNDNKIVYNKEVTKIIWDNPNDKVIVKCLDGSEYIADHVIFTPSLAVLKHQHHSMFHPKLPTSKVDAIEALGIDAVMKIFLLFENKFWFDDFPNNLVFFWTKEELANLTHEFPFGPNKNGISWLEDLISIMWFDKNPNVLSTWWSGKFIPEIELLSDDVLIDGIVFVLNKFLGNEFKIERPVDIIRSTWHNNDHFRGSYSFETVKSRKTNLSGAEGLLKPLMTGQGKCTLLFAGEATNLNHYGTVHGAIETGFREANRIIDFYK